MNRVGLQASGGRAMSAEDHAKRVVRCGELVRGLQRPHDALKPEA